MEEYFKKNRGLSAQVAKEFGFSRGHISNVIRGKRRCSIDLALFLNKKSDGIITLENSLGKARADHLIKILGENHG